MRAIKVIIPPASGFGPTPRFKISEVKSIIKILNKRVLPEFRSRKERHRIGRAIVDAVGLLVQSKSYSEIGNPPPTEIDNPRPIKFNPDRLAVLKKSADKYCRLISEIDDITLENIEIYLAENKQIGNYYDNYMKDLGFKIPSHISLHKIREHVMEVTQCFLSIMDLMSNNSTYRHKDQVTRRTILRLSNLYSEITKEPIKVGGVLQQFIEAVIRPVTYKTFSAEAHLRDLKSSSG